jgi:hypothetical protein
VLSLDSVRKEDGRKLDRFFVIICINAVQLQVQFIIHFLPVPSGFHFHTHAFRSLLHVFYALRTVHVTSVTSHQYGIEHSSGELWHKQPSSAHESAITPDKIHQKCRKVEILWVHTYPTTSSRPRGRRVQSLVQISSEMWICISSIQTFIFICKISLLLIFQNYRHIYSYNKIYHW